MRGRVALVVLLLVSAWLAGRVRSSGQDWGDDFAAYLMQAASLVDGTTGEFLAHNRRTVFESDYVMGPVAYPWGFPLMLAPIVASRGIDLGAVKLVLTACFLGALACWWAWLRRGRLGEAEALALVAVLAFNPWMAGFQDRVFSDLPFMLATAAVLLAAEVPSGWGPRVDGFLVGALIGASSTVRVQALALLAAFSVGEPAEGRARLGPAWLGFGAVALAAWLVLPPAGGGYLQAYLGATPAMAVENVFIYLGAGRELFGALGRPEAWALALFVTTGLGALVAGRRDRTALVGILLVYPPVLVSSFAAGLRYQLATLPAILYFAYLGVRGLATRVAGSEAGGRTVAMGLAGALALVSARATFEAGSANLARGRAVPGPYAPASQELFAAVRRHVPPGEAVVFFKPRAMRFMTGRDSIKSASCAALARVRWAAIELGGAARERSTPGARRIDQMSLAEALACGGAPETVFENAGFRLLHWREARPGT